MMTSDLDGPLEDAIIFANQQLKRGQLQQGLLSREPLEVNYLREDIDPIRSLKVRVYYYSKTSVKVHVILNNHTIVAEGNGSYLEEALRFAEGATIQSLHASLTRERERTQEDLKKAQGKRRRRDEALWTQIYASVIGPLLKDKAPLVAFDMARDAANKGLAELRKARD